MGKKGLFHLTDCNQGKSGQELNAWTWEAGFEAQPMEECCLLKCLLFHGWLNLAFLYTPGPSAWSGTTHSRLCPLTSIINQENISKTCLHTNLIEAFSKFGFPLPRPCVKLIKNYSAHFSYDICDQLYNCPQEIFEYNV